MLRDLRILEDLFTNTSWTPNCVSEFCNSQGMSPELRLLVLISFERIYWMQFDHGRGSGDKLFLKCVKRHELTLVQAAMLYAATMIGSDFDADERDLKERRAATSPDKHPPLKHLLSLMLSTYGLGFRWDRLRVVANSMSFFSHQYSQRFEQVHRHCNELLDAEEVEPLELIAVAA